MQRFFSLLSDGVRRFEGTVDKFTGDGIMALFGAPIAHEDHAPRACFAALHIGELVSEYAGELRRAKGLSFSVRIGINSGEVVAGAIGEDHKPEYTAVGHTVGLAQRMEALAEPGKAYLTEHAADLAARLPGAEGPRRVRGQGGEPSDQGLRADRGGLGAIATRPLARAWAEPIRRQGGGDGGPRGGARAGQGGAWRRDRRGRRPRRRQEPPLPRVRGAMQGARDRGLRGPGSGARPGDPVPAGAADAARVLRDRGPRLGAGRAREDRRPAAAPRSRLRGRPAARLRLPRRARSGAPGAAGERRGAGTAPSRRDQAPLPGPRAHRGGRQRDRGPALDGRGQRGVPGRDGRRGGGNRDPGGGQLPAGVRGRVGGLAGVPADRR